MKLVRCILAVGLAATYGAGVLGEKPTRGGKSSNTQVTHPSTASLTTSDALLVPRGGGGATIIPTIDPVLAAKVFATIYGINGLQGVLTPVPHIKMYFIRDEPSTVAASRTATLTSLGCATGVLFYLQLTKKSLSFEKAFGYSLAPMLYNFCYKLYSGDYKMEPLIPALFILAGMFAGITEASVAPLIMKLFAVVLLANGIFCYVAPVWSAKEGIVWAPKLDPGKKDSFFWVLSGAYQLTLAAAIGLPAVFEEMDLTTVIGWTVTITSALLTFIATTDLMPNATLPKAPLFGWIGLCVYLAFSMLFAPSNAP